MSDGIYNNDLSDLAGGDTLGEFVPFQLWAGEAPRTTNAITVKVGIAVEKFRVVGRDVNGFGVPWNPTAVASEGLAYATGTLTFVGNPADAATVNIMGATATFKGTVSGAGQVQIGPTKEVTALNLEDYVNENFGTIGANGSLASADVLVLTAEKPGTAANSGTLVSSSTAVTAGGTVFAGGSMVTRAAPEAKPIGFMAQPVDATGGATSGPYFRSGCVNFDALVWPAGTTLGEAQAAFDGTPMDVRTLDNTILNT